MWVLLGSRRGSPGVCVSLGAGVSPAVCVRPLGYVRVPRFAQQKALREGQACLLRAVPVRPHGQGGPVRAGAELLELPLGRVLGTIATVGLVGRMVSAGGRGQAQDGEGARGQCPSPALGAGWGSGLHWEAPIGLCTPKSLLGLACSLGSSPSRSSCCASAEVARRCPSRKTLPCLLRALGHRPWGLPQQPALQSHGSPSHGSPTAETSHRREFPPHSPLLSPRPPSQVWSRPERPRARSAGLLRST